MKIIKCDECDQKDRLHIDPTFIIVKYGKSRPALICDECYELENPGIIACCEDGCKLPLDHYGICEK